MGLDGVNRGINILQINLHHCREANDHLEDYVHKYDIDLILAQDPYISGNSSPGVPSDWISYFSTNFTSVIFIVNKGFISIECFKVTNTVFISLNLTDRIIYIGSQYSPPSGNIDQDFAEWTGLFPDFDNILIGGDFNVPLLNLGYSRENERTDFLLESLIDNGLAIMNDTDAPYSFVQGDISGRPDLTLSSHYLSQFISNWQVDDRIFSYSDHRYIRFTIDLIPSIINNVRFKTKNKPFNKFNKLFDFYTKEWSRTLAVINDPDILDV